MGVIDRRRIFALPRFGVGRHDISAKRGDTILAPFSSLVLSILLYKKKSLRSSHCPRDLRRENNPSVAI